MCYLLPFLARRLLYTHKKSALKKKKKLLYRWLYCCDVDYIVDIEARNHWTA